MWIVLKDIILSEISQTEKEKYCMISLNVEYENKTRQKLLMSVDTENRLVVARGGGWEVGEIGEESQRYKHPVIE